jgi:hypothetical protein
LRGIRLAPAGGSRIFQDDNEQLVRFIPIVVGETGPAWPKEPLREKNTNAMLTDIFAGAARSNGSGGARAPITLRNSLARRDAPIASSCERGPLRSGIPRAGG